MRVIHAYYYPREHPRGTRFTISRINLGGCGGGWPPPSPRANIAAPALSPHGICDARSLASTPGVREADTYDCFKRGIHHRRFLFDANVGWNALTSFQMDIFIGHRPDAIARPNERQTYHKSRRDRDLDGHLLCHRMCFFVYILFKG